MALVTKVYESTKLFPKDEIFGLTSQIRRSCISIPSNIAEGYGRNSNIELVRYVNIAIASLFELQTQLEIAYDVGYMDEPAFEAYTRIPVSWKL
jgi:four helix bundle protein